MGSEAGLLLGSRAPLVLRIFLKIMGFKIQDSQTIVSHILES